jgi:hypothetical protein
MKAANEGAILTHSGELLGVTLVYTVTLSYLISAST